MATAVARRNSPRIGRPSSRTASPMDNKKAALKSEENSRKNSPLQTKSSLPATTQTTSQPATQAEESKSAVQASEPLAPPPRPAQANNSESTDYFSGLHNGGSQFSLEPNPFEQSFGAPSTETPGKILLPSVAALTSPAIPGTSSTGGYNWGSHSLRSGPLSPAMLAGPAGSGDYFDSIGRGFPTPNESSLRTGLTPGGGGSMFPVPSPNSQALFQALQNGGATPGTVDFHRTAINAAARTKNNQFGQTSNSQEQNQQNTKMDKSQQEQFASHDAEAANGLFMLAKGGQTSNQYAMANQQMQQQQQPVQNNQNVNAQDSHRRNTASMGSLSGPDMSGQQSDSHEEVSKPTTRGGRGKKTAKAQAAAAGTRRKADDMSQKSSNKRSKGNSSSINVDPSLSLEPPDEDEDDSNEEEPTHDANGKKMTDEEKRKNFLERNRVAALKCRQRKKQWLANLQAKVELFSTENDALSSQPVVLVLLFKVLSLLVHESKKDHRISYPSVQLNNFQSTTKRSGSTLTNLTGLLNYRNLNIERSN
ncbi:hypothetical protein GJ744_011717 [Endocarpon pusillum]|uniref:BZIP domain-containing protein n=1 Tax=Endocarpon pusillum TaxID=364733 RepID=A0A8H7AG94_9EURO|nr:hypothetical protein GJ744_011717 [Endocarpon pusillum]